MNRVLVEFVCQVVPARLKAALNDKIKDLRKKDLAYAIMTLSRMFTSHTIAYYHISVIIKTEPCKRDASLQVLRCTEELWKTETELNRFDSYREGRLIVNMLV